MASTSSLGTESPIGTKKRVRDDSPIAARPLLAPASNAFAMMGRASKALRGGLVPSGAAPASDSEVSSSLPSSSLSAPLVALPPKTVATRSIGSFFASKSGRPPPPVVQHSAALLSNPTQSALPTESGDDDSESSLLPSLTDAPLVGVAPLTSFFSKASASTPLAVLPPLPRGICGLSNLGFTCYMSAIVQALIACVPLAAYFRQGHFAADLREHGQFGSGARIAIAFAALLGDMDAVFAARSRYVAPRALRTAVCRRTSAFPSGMQDAQEFLQFMLEHLHDDCSNRAQSAGGGTVAEAASLSNLPSSIQADAVAGTGSGRESQRRSVLSDLFQGHCKQRLRCRTCLSESVKVDPFNSISVPLPANTLPCRVLPICPTSTSEPQTVSAPADAQVIGDSAPVAAALTDSETSPSAPCELVDCLRLFTAAETLSDGFLCSTCKKSQEVETQTEFTSLPACLVFHLKRFGFQQQGAVRTKLDLAVNYPWQGLDLSEFVPDAAKETAIYDLFATVNHFGSGAGSGHYTAFSLRDADAVADSAPATAASATVSNATESASSSEEPAWWRLDDSRVERLPDPPSAHAANARSAYLLFYRRRDHIVPDFGAAPSASNVAAIIAAMQASVEAAAIDLEAPAELGGAATACADAASESASVTESVASAVIDLD